ncbi:trypsin-like peptidase domain-containing protein [Streptomyces mirabilis]|uniref:trypsin-like peptidase domain-containing protein n=1 Tax=Streptomyces mirabilis TaxID=68239 RepID=UPI002255850E|nr:trypsin-like peptidase domain-containing protein [Streptomyces mirabilis]MCX4421006.1 serine protease [Streptomyces mirabilis]
MAGRGLRTGNEQTPDDDRRARDETLVRVCDLAGRPRGTGFVADHHGTVITSHEAVDGLARLVLHAPGGRSCVVTADSVTPLPETDLALVRTEGLGLDPLPVTVRERVETGTYVLIPAGGWREARVLGSTTVTYTATDRLHLLDEALELAIGTAGADALRLGGGAAGGPVLDASTGAVIGVLGTALHTEHRAAGFAVPLRTPGVTGPLAELLDRNATTVPAYGADLNPAGVLALTATSVGSDGPGAATSPGTDGVTHVTVERAAVVREFTAFESGPAAVLGLVGPPGSGRTTELAALAARRTRGTEPAPTLWLRGADLLATDTSVADAATRALERAGRIVAASEEGAHREPGVLPPGGYEGELGDIGPDRLARLAAATGRPLLLLLDGPEEMPPDLADRLPEWTAGTAEWLRSSGARLVVACRAEYWEQVGTGFPAESLHRAGADPELPPCVRLGDLTEEEARRLRSRAGIPEDALVAGDARHPLTLRLLAELRAALPDPPTRPLDREEVFTAHLDLMCLRVAVRLAAANGLRGTAVRRLAAQVSGQVHEAARRCLGPGQGRLDRVSFEAVFPWGPAPGGRLGSVSGWASAVLTEGLLVPAGSGYRFAHEELADWIQGTHLDLDPALHALVHRRREAWRTERVPAQRSPVDPSAQSGSVPVPRHRIGPVVQALLLLARHQGAGAPARRLADLVEAVDDLLAEESAPAGDGAAAGDDGPAGEDGPAGDGIWWATHLLVGVLVRVPDATPYTRVLRLLAERIVAWRTEGRGVPAEFGPSFWEALPLPEAERFDLLRRLVVADWAPRQASPAEGSRTASGAHRRRPREAPRYLDAVARLLAADPTAVQPHLIPWFDDDRPLPATPHATVATAAQALLYAHRRRALDDLTEALIGRAHRRGDELLAALAEEEPSAVCRAVDRWAHDERPARRVAAMAYGLRAAPHAHTEADRELLRFAALTLLARPADRMLHGAALGLLVRDPWTRARHLPQALERFAAGDPQLPAGALVAALNTHPDPVLEAFRVRLRRPGADTSEALRTLADVTTPALARRVGVLVREVVELCPEAAAHVAAYVDRRLEHGSAARSVLFPLVSGLLVGCPAPVRAALAAVLAAPGSRDCGPLRRELLDLLLAHEQDPAVLDSLLRAAADGAARRGEEPTRELVHRTGLLLVRTPAGATGFDRGLVELARRVPGFATLVARWLTGSPEEWAGVVGPSTRRTIENLAEPRVPA